MKICEYCRNYISDEKYDNHIRKHEMSIEATNYRARQFEEAKNTLTSIENSLVDMDIESMENMDMSPVTFCILNKINYAPNIESAKITIRSIKMEKVPKTQYKIKNIYAKVAYKKLYFAVVYAADLHNMYNSITLGSGCITTNKNLKITFDTAYDIDEVPIPYRLWFKSRVKSKLLTEARVFNRNIFKIHEGE